MQLSHAYLQEKIIIFHLTHFSIDARIGKNNHFSIYCTISLRGVSENFQVQPWQKNNISVKPIEFFLLRASNLIDEPNAFMNMSTSNQCLLHA